MIPIGVLRPLLPLVQALVSLHVPYQIGGSVASSLWGLGRSTQDADIVADLRLLHVDPLVAQLEDQYYIDAEMIRDAIRHRSSFNIIYLETMFKIDVFIRKPTAFEDATFQRARRQPIDDPPDLEVVFTSPEDIILHKLVWYQMGGGVSERQWLDAIGVLKMQGPTLDSAYLHNWATRLGVSDLLARALDDAGISP